MPPIHIVLAAAAVALSVPILIYSVGSRMSTGLFERRIGSGEGTTDVEGVLLHGSAGERVVAPAVRGMLGIIRRVTPAGLVDALERRMRFAGMTSSAEPMIVLKFVLAAGAGYGAYVYSEQPLIAALGVFVGFFAIDTIIGVLARARQEQILDALPQIMDQLTMSVEAGVGFEAALGRSARAGVGPLNQELRRTLQEMQLGASRTQALRHLAERNDLVDLRAFVNAVAQSEDYGIPVAHVLRVQSQELKVKRRQRAEERAMKIPVKIVFPLVICIFPALMVVLLGPAALRIQEALL
jgi:tight adherence protein C